MEIENDVDTRSLEDIIRRQENSACKRRLRQMGYSERESEVACATLITLKKDEAEPKNRDDFQLLFVDSEYDKRRIDSVVGMLKMIGGSGQTGGMGRTSNISLRKISSLIKTLKTTKGKKVGHMGLPPALVSLPQKSLHKLQTKLEKVFTAEEKFLTAEQREQRAQYAITMKKQDAIEIAEIIGEENMKYLKFDDAYFNDEIIIDNINNGLNNILKAPVILAKELVQEYIFINEDGSRRSENHFKPFDELAKAVEALETLPMIIEHKDEWKEEEEVGYVKQFVADNKIRAIRGTAYFYENRLPQVLIDAIKRKIPIAVSIGFMAELGGSGLWEGLVYDHTQENIILDHLAIVVKSMPRCSIDKCGINLGDEKKAQESTEKTKQFTIINKGNYYYNISNLIDTEETRIEKQNSDKKNKSDSMKEDSFPDPQSGLLAGGEPNDLEVYLKRMRAYINGAHPLEEKNFFRTKVNEILSITDEGTDEPSETLKGEDNMEQKEFEDALAKKDEELAVLKEIVKESLIKDIRSFTDAKTQEKLKLDEKCVHDLKIIKDTVSTFEPIKEEPDVLPIESKEKKREEMEDAGAAPSEKKRYDTSEMFAKINEEFEESGFIIRG